MLNLVPDIQQDVLFLERGRVAEKSLRPRLMGECRGSCRGKTLSTEYSVVSYYGMRDHLLFRSCRFQHRLIDERLELLGKLGDRFRKAGTIGQVVNLIGIICMVIEFSPRIAT